jgi:hypothetical protein
MLIDLDDLCQTYGIAATWKVFLNGFVPFAWVWDDDRVEYVPVMFRTYLPTFQAWVKDYQAK